SSSDNRSGEGVYQGKVIYFLKKLSLRLPIKIESEIRLEADVVEVGRFQNTSSFLPGNAFWDYFEKIHFETTLNDKIIK
ncbi:MAG: hypothetical protein II642_08835, partial [Firmicutes bacterium]|nr:hypothetical protein [Bacillota bacterium]